MQEHHAYVGADGDRDHREGDHGTDLVARGERGDPGTGGGGLRGAGRRRAHDTGGLRGTSGLCGTGHLRGTNGLWNNGYLWDIGGLTGTGCLWGSICLRGGGLRRIGFAVRPVGPGGPAGPAGPVLPLPGVRALVVRVHSAPFGPDPSIRPPRHGTPARHRRPRRHPCDCSATFEPERYSGPAMRTAPGGPAAPWPSPHPAGTA
ncbi:hypothetical protein GCM10010330_14160 [Streptomyces tendae]|nr:hypothetical protein GCM10010330_14160 [Streptomyces tendae]